MAARLRKMHQDDVRAKIQTSQLINRLENHALGELELTATQIKAIEVLIRKTLPDLSAVEMTGEDGGPIETVQTIQLVGPDDNEAD
jgi:hypothetical protein